MHRELEPTGPDLDSQLFVTQRRGQLQCSATREPTAEGRRVLTAGCLLEESILRFVLKYVLHPW